MSKPTNPLHAWVQLAAVASKEVRLIASQRIALALVLVYPALVMLSLALAFGQGNAYADYFGKPAIEIVSVALFLPASTPEFNREDFLAKIRDQNTLKLEFVSTPEQVRENVATGRNTVGLVVAPPAEKNNPIGVDVLYDNSSVVAGKAISAQVASAVRRVAYSTSSEILGDIWRDLDKIESDLGSENAKLQEFMDAISRTKGKLDKLDDQFGSIDLGKESADLKVFNAFYDDTKASMGSSRQGLDETRALLLAYKSKVYEAGTSTSNNQVELLRIRQSLGQMMAYTAEPLRSQLQQMQNSLTVQVNSMNKVSADLQGVLVDIDNTIAKVDNAFAGLEASEAGLENAKQAVGGFEGSVESLKQTVEEGKPTVHDAKESQAEISEDVKKTTQLMDEMLLNVGRFKAYKPGYLVTPVQVEEKQAFPASQLEAVTPVGIAIVLLLTCILLTALSVVLERNAGISARIAVASVGRFTWLSGKLLGQLVFALVEAGIVLALAVYVFNVPFHAEPLTFFALLVLVALAFSSIGLFISNFTQSVSTAVLGSLLAMIPMLFLSGTLFPFEFMPAGIAEFSRLLPLTAAKEALLAVMVKGGGPALVLPQVGLLAGVAVLLTAASWLKKER